MGFVTAGVSYTTGEITSFMPSTGGFVRHATKFVEPALGAATGWNFCKLGQLGSTLGILTWRRVYDVNISSCRNQRSGDVDSVLERICQSWGLDHSIPRFYNRCKHLRRSTLW